VVAVVVGVGSGSGAGATDVEAAASARPTWISVPAGNPPWSAVSTTRSVVIAARA
jgi:hypothetical protein